MPRRSDINSTALWRGLSEEVPPNSPGASLIERRPEGKRIWSCLTTILRLVASGVGVRGVEVGELPSHSGGGESDNQSNCEKELLHGDSPINAWPVDLAFEVRTGWPWSALNE